MLILKLMNLKKDCRFLKSKLKKAYKYKQISDDLKNIEVGYLVYEIEKNTKIHNQLSEELAGVAETEIAYKNDIKSLSDQINEKTDKIKEITKIISQFSANKKVIEAHISSLEQTIMEAKFQKKCSCRRKRSVRWKRKNECSY
ncbi:hypothetical protein NW070_03355 [Mycoplasmopsis cynos]|nr:hypothetical protein [Mycoplasmopsis cynos]UWV77891.1 hypothetical protein NW070_03355 [Mycoplasmopsis cynos]